MTFHDPLRHAGVPGEDSGRQRKQGRKPAAEAAAAGVSPEVLHVEPATGIMVTRFVDGAVTMTPEAFAARAGAPVRAGEALSRLHGSGAVFPFRFELFAMIDEYLAILSTKDVTLPEGYHQVVNEAEAVRTALSAHPVPLAPCHCDPLCENFLDTGKRMWIVDWEYAGMNDPMWDLGDLSVEGAFGPEQDAALLHALEAGWRKAGGALKRIATAQRDLFRRPLEPDEFKGVEAVVIDPPRAGAEAQMATLARSGVPVIASVSCNPISFARDAKTLIAGGYHLDWVQVVDQFRWSAHVELVARFSRS